MILFIDSGTGGLSYLDEFVQRRPDSDVAYLADLEYFPYGDRMPDDVRRRVLGAVGSVYRVMQLEAAVVACNTASVVALDALRATYPFPIIGVVPAVKPAAAATKTGHIAVLATNRTASDPYTDGLIATFARVAEVTRIGLPQLVGAAERYRCSGDDGEAAELIEREVQSRLPAEVDTVVLACTHFVQLRATFERVLGARIDVIDSLDGVTRRALSIVAPNDRHQRRRLFFETSPGFGRTCANDPRQWTRLEIERQTEPA